ncbi:MAG: hypothetical protein ACP5FL_03895 [Thermoplasmatota archaeon]
MVKFGVFDPTNKKHWIELLRSGNYIPYKTELGAHVETDPTMKYVSLKRRKGVDAPKIPKWFHIELPDRKADEFIEQIKRDSGYK